MKPVAMLLAFVLVPAACDVRPEVRAELDPSVPSVREVVWLPLVPLEVEARPADDSGWSPELRAAIDAVVSAAVESAQPDELLPWDGTVRIATLEDGLEVVAVAGPARAPGWPVYTLFVHERASGRVGPAHGGWSGQWHDQRGLFLRRADLEGDGKLELAVLDCHYSGTDTRREEAVLLAVEEDLALTEVLRFVEVSHGARFRPLDADPNGDDFEPARRYASPCVPTSVPRTELILSRWCTTTDVEGEYLGHEAALLYRRDPERGVWSLDDGSMSSGCGASLHEPRTGK